MLSKKSYALTRYSSLEQKYLDLKFLSRQYNQRVATKVVNRVHLGNLLDEAMPGIETILMSKTTNPENNMLYNFIVKYKNFDVIKSMGKKRFLNSYTKLAEKMVVVIMPEKPYRFMNWPLTASSPVGQTPIRNWLLSNA